ncbi:GGDEF domain-containing protein [Pseudomonas sp. PCH199]|uniref:GGDEF domain-containing protein n=1 Tax=unclassified Pseudomonas TaxID=196821 RepID=UPI000BD85D65|nr:MULTISPECIES: GGDEF domain-containing protein [unclassified Pseudomonas]MCW8278707.1 GGDEF domain-containing protein [Pseudomonas sp. PCH199]PAM81034.1 GGDEF domain-containing protein [Pseudomonas sp. ERMR1:02]
MLIPGKPHKTGVCAGTSQQERELLRDLARKAEQELIGVQMASMDELTLLPNRHGFIALAKLGLEACMQLERPATLLFFNLDEFKRINYLYGRAEGDNALKTYADVLRIGFRESDVIGRLEGATFVALLTGSCGVDITAIRARLEEMLDERNATAHRSYDIRFSIGQIEYDPVDHDSVEALLVEAETVLGR